MTIDEKLNTLRAAMQVVTGLSDSLSGERQVHRAMQIDDMMKTALEAAERQWGMEESPTTSVNEAIWLLNGMLKMDPAAVTLLMEIRVACNEALADHPTVQVTKKDDGTHEVGLLGLLNGIFGVRADDLYGHVTATYEQDSDTGELGKIVGFSPTKLHRDELPGGPLSRKKWAAFLGFDLDKVFPPERKVK